MKMHVWTDRFSFLAVAHSDSVVESRKMLLAGSLGESGDGSCPERDKARRTVLETMPEIWLGPNEEFVLTDSAEVRELEDELDRQHRRRETLEIALQSVREIVMQSEMQCHHPQDDGGDSCDGSDCIFCAVIHAIDGAVTERASLSGLATAAAREANPKETSTPDPTHQGSN